MQTCVTFAPQVSASLAASQGPSIHSRQDLEQWLHKMQTPPTKEEERGRSGSGSPVPVNQAVRVCSVLLLLGLLIPRLLPRPRRVSADAQLTPPGEHAIMEPSC